MPSFPQLSQLIAEHTDLVSPKFTTASAWKLGTHLRSLALQEHPDVPVAIRISLPTGQILFTTYTCGPTNADSESWLNRKAATVFRWGTSTMFQGQKLRDSGLPGKQLSEKAEVDDQEYACHGGGFPIRVKGVEGVVAAVVVSGLAQEEDHDLAVRAVRYWIEGVEKEAKQ